MKYCVKCGKEIHDEAVICPNCGCATKETEIKKAESDKTNVQSKKGRTSKILGIISVLLLWPLGIASIILAVQSKNETGGEMNKDAKSGLILGIIALIWGVLVLTYFL